MRSQPSIYARNRESYRRLERTHKRWRTIRSHFDLTIEAAAFFIGRDESHTSAALERQAETYFATLLGYERLERTNGILRAQRLREGLSVGEAAFLFAGIEDTGPLPNKLRAARLRTGLGQADVARLIGTSRPMVAHYERGTREPDLVIAMTLSVLYDLSLEKLFPQRVLNLRLKKRQRMLAVWRQTQHSSHASAVP